MGSLAHPVVFLSLVLQYLTVTSCHPTPRESVLSIRMPGAISSREDDLVCHSQKVDSTRISYIEIFEPFASKEEVHHMMLYGCLEPVTDEDWWVCDDAGDDPTHGICEGGSHEIVYAWALDAGSKHLPRGVGFPVGGNTDIQYLVLQLHYRYKFPEGVVDNTTGVDLHLNSIPPPMIAGYYILASYGSIPAHVKDHHVEVACIYDGDEPIYPFAYRTHSHNLGVVTSGYRVQNDSWTEIGRMSPQQPQMFYPATSKDIEIRKGDVLAARCTMTSDRDEETTFGPTNHDEMCNFYIMYATKRGADTSVQMCLRESKTFHWSDYLENIPDTASSLEGVHLLYNKTNHHHHNHKESDQMRFV